MNVSCRLSVCGWIGLAIAISSSVYAVDFEKEIHDDDEDAEEADSGDEGEEGEEDGEER